MIYHHECLTQKDVSYWRLQLYSNYTSHLYSIGGLTCMEGNVCIWSISRWFSTPPPGTVSIYYVAVICFHVTAAGFYTTYGVDLPIIFLILQFTMSLITEIIEQASESWSGQGCSETRVWKWSFPVRGLLAMKVRFLPVLVCNKWM